MTNNLPIAEEQQEEQQPMSELQEEQPSQEELSEEVVEQISSQMQEDLGEGLPPLQQHERIPLLYALLFAHSEPLGVDRLAEVSGLTKDEVNEALLGLKEWCSAENCGVELTQVGNKYQLRTKAWCGPFIRVLRMEKPKRLTNPALETLAIIAYKQPIVRSEIERIRGVDTTPTLKTLLERNLIRIVGHQPTVGNPSLYGTTEEFLKIFGLSGLPDLPTLREIGQFENDPGEVEEEYTEDVVMPIDEAQGG